MVSSGARLTIPMLLVVVLLLLLCSLGIHGQRVDVVVDGGNQAAGPRRRAVDVGVILDRTTWLGNISWACMELAMEDFYADRRHAGFRTRLRLHLRDTRLDAVEAASAGVDLLKNVHVQAIIGPQTSAQAKFLAELGNKSSVPIISFSANSPCRSPSQSPYFIRTAWNDSSQAEVIASLVQKFNWRDVIPVIEDDDSNTRFIPDLVDALRKAEIRVSHRCKIHPSAEEDDLQKIILSLKEKWTSVFVVRMSYDVALRFFKHAKDEGMMGQGFVWIAAHGLTDIFDIVGSPAYDVMQGVIGLKPYVNDTKQLQNFKQRWRIKYQTENPGTSLSEPTISGLYAYDTVWALAVAAERAGYVNSDFLLSEKNNGSTDFDRISTSKAANKLQGTLLNIDFLGMSGKFHIQDMHLLSTTYEIINIVGKEKRVVGFWTPKFNISRSLSTEADIDAIIWPGGNTATPKGWLFPMNKTLKIGVPAKPGFSGFIKLENGIFKGFCIDVFKEVTDALPYKILYRYEQFGNGKGESNGTYDELVYNVYLKSGVRMLVPVQDRRQKTAWTFLQPLTADLWLGAGAFFIFTGFVVWFIEHRTNEGFRGPPVSQIGSVFYFSFSTLVFAHREKIVNNLSRIVLVIWIFVVLILQQSYTASLSSILTVEQLRPTVTNLDEVIRKGGNVGYLNDSFMPGLLKRLKIDESKLIALDSPDEYNEALSTGRVAVVVDEIPYLKVFLSKYCHNYTLVGPTYKFDGFGFAFPRGSPLTAEISREILNFASSDRMAQLEKELYRNRTCPQKDESETSSSLTLRSFLGLFIITGSSSLLALILHVVITLYNHRPDLSSASSQSSWCGWFAILLRIFHGGDRPNAPQMDENTITNVNVTTESPWSTPNHIVENVEPGSDMESIPEEETLDREDFVQGPDPPSFAYMHSERG
uniref:Glutamate receptor n=1 Tax=Leersia perrieri TaxID=77586 RepID=A0A0D9XDZ7_9ORYZ